MIARLPCPVLSCMSSTATITIPLTPFHLHSPQTQANTPSRWLRLAHSLDLQLRLRLRPLQLEDPHDRRPRSLRRLGPWRQRHRRSRRPRPRRLARRQRRRPLRRRRQRLGSLVHSHLRRVDRRPLDKLVGRLSVPCFDLERLD
jgi:hypothetical protein